MTKAKWMLLIFLIIMLIAARSIWKYYHLETPQDYIKTALERLSEAEGVKSGKYASKSFKEANTYYDSAIYYWKAENNKWFFQRNFEKSIYSAKKSEELSKIAINEAKSSSKYIESVLSKQIRTLSEKVEEFNRSYQTIPLSKEQRTNWVLGKMLLEEGIQAFKNQNYLFATKKLDSARLIIDDIHNFPKELLRKYLENYDLWEKWHQAFIEKNKRNKTIGIVVDKIGRKCYIYKSGKLLISYEIELSPNWIGDKHFQGDRATPEGFYKVTRKKEKGDTKYYKALLLNYPNEEDKIRFKENKDKGIIAANAKIGGLIEIHGHGGKGVDWTDGCVALSDDLMDKIFNLASVGTEVLIVGSTKPIDELIDNEQATK